VQNLGNTATSYSGMLFYDQNGALGQFQGFNNVTHEYRINNVATAPTGSINFMVGSASKFFVAGNGNIGIGTTAPSAMLEVSNAIPGGPANMWMTSYTNAINPYYMARRARGTAGAPTAVLSGDGLAGFYGEGYGATAFGSGFAGGMTVQAAQNWTDTAHGTALTFATTAFNTTATTTRMTLDAGGNFGIGTSFPTALLEISNGLTPASPASATIATYNAAPGGSFLTGRKARGTSAAPTAVQNGDGLLSLSGRGYGTSQFGVGGGATIGMRATENYTNTAMGGLIQFFTTPNGTTTLTPRMTIDQNGFVGIGIGNNTPNGMLDIARDGTTNLIGTSYGGQGTGFKAKASRGTLAAPTATQLGDELAEFTAAGYGATGFNETAGWAAFAAENWTDTAQGTVMGLFNTPIGSNEAQFYVAILPNGNVGINPQFDVNEFPIANDKLQVFGDIRVGTSGTNGCLKDFSGTGIIGTCSSDRRLKKNITPFGPTLDKVAALQPVHYYWRASEFPSQHFGDAQNSGLIAQDVEQVLPELVATDGDGYKAVDYSKLPLLTIQAVKELKSENDALKKENDAVKQRIAELDPLKQRVAELERLVAELLATSARR
jgi:trimeric autotransporter adhesin